MLRLIKKKKFNSGNSMILSTVELPDNKGYESCLFVTNEYSEVIDSYATLAQAIEGHARLIEKFGLDK